MKKAVQPRLMKVYQIENNYQKHRQRLMSIQHFDTKKKQNISTIRPSDATLNYKQNRLKADVYAYRTKADQIQHQNMLLLSKIERQYTKTSGMQNRSQMGSRQSQRSLNSSSSSRKIDLQNKRIYSKINKMTSSYSKIRKQQKNKSSGKISNKEEILNLLVNQFGVKPSVLFPALSKKQPTYSRNSNIVARRQSTQQKMLKFNFNNIEKLKKKHSLTVYQP